MRIDRRTNGTIFYKRSSWTRSVYERRANVQKSLKENAGEGVRTKKNSQRVDSVRTVKSVRDGV